MRWRWRFATPLTRPRGRGSNRHERRAAALPVALDSDGFERGRRRRAGCFFEEISRQRTGVFRSASREDRRRRIPRGPRRGIAAEVQAIGRRGGGGFRAGGEADRKSKRL